MNMYITNWFHFFILSIEIPSEKYDLFYVCVFSKLWANKYTNKFNLKQISWNAHILSNEHPFSLNRGCSNKRWHTTYVNLKEKKIGFESLPFLLWSNQWEGLIWLPYEMEIGFESIILIQGVWMNSRKYAQLRIYIRIRLDERNTNHIWMNHSSANREYSTLVW